MAPSPSPAAAGTVSRSPCARRSPGGATPGAMAAATAEPNDGPQGRDELRGQFVFWAGMWRQVVAAGPKQTTVVAITFRPPDSAGRLPDEKWEVGTVKKVFATADILAQLQHQKAVPADSWEHAVSEHSRGVRGCMALTAASATPGSPCGGGPGGSGGGGGGAGGAPEQAAAGGCGLAGGGGLSASRPLGGGGAAGGGSAGAAQSDPPPPHPQGQTL